MKFGKKAVLAGILTAVMIAGSSVTVLAAETSQIPGENSQSVTQQEGQPAEKKVRKNKALSDSESTSEGGFKNGRHHGKGMISEDGTEEIKKFRHHIKENSDVQTNEDGTGTSKRRHHKKDTSSAAATAEQTENA